MFQKLYVEFDSLKADIHELVPNTTLVDGEPLKEHLLAKIDKMISILKQCETKSESLSSKTYFCHCGREINTISTVLRSFHE